MKPYQYIINSIIVIISFALFFNFSIKQANASQGFSLSPLVISTFDGNAQNITLTNRSAEPLTLSLKVVPIKQSYTQGASAILATNLNNQAKRYLNSIKLSLVGQTVNTLALDPYQKKTLTITLPSMSDHPDYFFYILFITKHMNSSTPKNISFQANLFQETGIGCLVAVHNSHSKEQLPPIINFMNPLRIFTNAPVRELLAISNRSHTYEPIIINANVGNIFGIKVTDETLPESIIFANTDRQIPLDLNLSYSGIGLDTISIRLIGLESDYTATKKLTIIFIPISFILIIGMIILLILITANKVKKRLNRNKI